MRTGTCLAPCLLQGMGHETFQTHGSSLAPGRLAGLGAQRHAGLSRHEIHALLVRRFERNTRARDEGTGASHQLKRSLMLLLMGGHNRQADEQLADERSVPRLPREPQTLPEQLLGPSVLTLPLCYAAEVAEDMCHPSGVSQIPHELHALFVHGLRSLEVASLLHHDTEGVERPRRPLRVS